MLEMSNHSNEQSGIGYARKHEKCHDRGNHYRLNNPSLSIQTGSAPQEPGDLNDALWAAKVSYSCKPAHRFIPLDKLGLARNRRLAKQALQESNIPEERISPLLGKICADESASGNHSFFRIFTILVLCERSAYIEKFIEHDVDDSCLPLPIVEWKNGTIIASPLQHKHERQLSEEKLNNLFENRADWRPNALKDFNDYQWWTIAPFFNRPKDIIPHYLLEADDRLPFTEKKNKIELDMNTMDQDVRDLVLQGGFGDVFIVKLHPSHYSFHDQPYSDGSHSFALKCLKSRNESEFTSEVDALRKYNYSIDKHLIPLLATIEKDDEAGKFYMLFPKANGDLRYFWETQFSRSSDPSLIPWMAKQCVGIAQALSTLHKDQNKDNGQDFPIYGRHGDIKAGNILWFAKPDTPGPAGWCLVLSDFGLTTFHRSISISVQTASKLNRTVTYQAPEFELVGKKVSRKSDIWALGCTYLDFITCYILDYGAVDQEFPSFRGAPDKNLANVNEDKFYLVTDDGLSAELKPTVKKWISGLRQHPKCSQYLGKFLAFIEERMLCIELGSRPTASEVANTLKGFLKAL
ncbi:kinase-like protein [Annulohypoxylon bovei var. microspora]|nr:kinase-like protein [Annulohypoxylon bovei var. microspora]